MNPNPLADLEELAAFMRKAGATRARTVEGVELELGPAPLAPLPPVKDEKPEPEPICPCGCPLDEHGPAGCYRGCSLEKCDRGTQHPQPEESQP